MADETVSSSPSSTSEPVSMIEMYNDYIIDANFSHLSI